MSAESILRQLGLSPSRVGELCERYGRNPRAENPLLADGVRFHRTVRRAVPAVAAVPTVPTTNESEAQS